MSKFNQGFSLIEILVATTILATTLVGLSLLMGMTIRSDTQARDRVIAGDLAQSGSDYLRQQRNIEGFGRLRMALSNNEVYCLETLATNFLDDQGVVNSIFKAVCDFTLEAEGTGTKFKRQAEAKQVSEELIEFEITVSWKADANRDAEVITTLQFRPR